jgi:hypothetical protein
LGNLSTPKTVQKLQKALRAKAKAEAGYRFYALYDKISREHILAHAYAQCRSNKGAPGVDGQDFADIDAYGGERWLCELALALRKESYGSYQKSVHPEGQRQNKMRDKRMRPIRLIPIRLIEPWRCTTPPGWREYAAMMRAGDEFPPVQVIRQSSKLRGYPYRLFDGYHRTRAAKHIGRRTIAAHVISDETMTWVTRR